MGLLGLVTMTIQKCGDSKFISRKAIGENLKSTRLQMGYESQTRASQNLPIELDTYRRWEQGRSLRTIEDILMLAQVWEVDHLWLYCKLTGEDELAYIVSQVSHH